MRYGLYINHGRDYTFVDERGAITGILMTWDDRIAGRVQKAYYGPPSKSEREVGKKILVPNSYLKIS
ncbi:hypothetical protein CJP46_35445 [Paenibacillus sp. XY044]|nr:hypothetical protein CJP46_35445 [Paenibacillus sp. XY044]